MQSVVHIHIYRYYEHTILYTHEILKYYDKHDMKYLKQTHDIKYLKQTHDIKYLKQTHDMTYYKTHDIKYIYRQTWYKILSIVFSIYQITKCAP